jgi:Tfp pilus assembly protein PilF
LELERFDEALASYNRAISIKPDNPEAYYNRGVLFFNLERFEDAIASYDRAIAIKPDYIQAHNNRGNTLKELKRLSEALGSFDRAISIKPDFADAYFNRGNTLRDLNRFDEALASFDRAASIRQDFALAHYNKCILLQELKRYDEARASLDRVLEAKPDYADAQASKAELLLLMGDYQQGWDLYEWRFKTKYLEAHSAAINLPLWTGQSIAGKRILIHSKAGYGDYLMFIRYVPLLKKLGATVIVFAPKPLLSLFSASDTDVQVVDMDGPVPEVDFQCPIMSLPKAFRTTLDTIPADLPYLKAPPEKLAYWRQKLPASEKLRIGLMWSGSPNRNIDKNPLRNRTAPLNAIRSLLDLPFEFHSLQKEPLENDAALLSSLTQIHTHQEELGDFSDTAALIDRMDLVISIDTSVAHLAGGLGKPLWVILPYSSDYRWAAESDKTPWYPNATQFRQNAVGDWENVIQRVKQRLRNIPKEI